MPRALPLYIQFWSTVLSGDIGPYTANTAPYYDGFIEFDMQVYITRYVGSGNDSSMSRTIQLVSPTSYIGSQPDPVSGANCITVAPIDKTSDQNTAIARCSNLNISENSWMFDDSTWTGDYVVYLEIYIKDDYMLNSSTRMKAFDTKTSGGYCTGIWLQDYTTTDANDGTIKKFTYAHMHQDYDDVPGFVTSGNAWGDTSKYWHRYRLDLKDEKILKYIRNAGSNPTPASLSAAFNTKWEVGDNGLYSGKWVNDHKAGPRPSSLCVVGNIISQTKTGTNTQQ